MKATEPIHVLLVEDEILVNEWVTQSLTEQGFAVQSVTNAADALGHLASDPVDVLFTDINLPGKMDGAALARRARELLPNLPVIYASARATMLAPDARVPGAIIVPKHRSREDWATTRGRDAPARRRPSCLAD